MRLSFDRSLDFRSGRYATSSSIRHLKHLQFHSCPITSADLLDLASLTNLESLWFDECPVGDEGIEELARLPKLVRVVLNNTHITDAALKHLATIPWLIGFGWMERLSPIVGSRISQRPRG